MHHSNKKAPRLTNGLPENAVISVRHMSKKFCRRLRRSMAYGIRDLTLNLVGVKPESTALRKDEFWALDDVGFELNRGEVLGLVGKNGSGKTTLLRLLAGILPPDKGEILVRGRVGALIALGAGFHPHMTGRENVFLYGTILGMSIAEIRRQFDSILEFSEIGEFIDAPLAAYSSGMQVRLGFSVATAFHPDLLLIDEVLAVGDTSFKTKCLNRINEIIRRCAVVFVSHSMEMVSYISNRIMVLHQGRIAYSSDDVFSGIEYYHSLLPPKKQGQRDVSTIELVEIRLSGNRVSAPEGELLKLSWGQELNVRLALNLKVPVWNPRINLIIVDKTGKDVADCHSDEWGFQMDGTAGIHNVELTIPSLPLNAGVYSVGVGIEDGASRMILLRCEDVAQFQMAGFYTSWATVLLRGEWREIPS